MKKGFTLIEVLIALMILAISLTAIVKASSTDIKNTQYLKEKALANLVALEAFELIKMHSIAFLGNKTEQKTTLANQNWFWQATKTNTQNRFIKKIIITVFYNKQAILSTKHFFFQGTP